MPGKAEDALAGRGPGLPERREHRPKGEARQSSTDFDGPARLAIDGKTEWRLRRGEVDDPHRHLRRPLVGSGPQGTRAHRTAGDLEPDRWQPPGATGRRPDLVLDEKRVPLWTQDIESAPQLSAEFSPSGERSLTFVAAFADDPRASTGRARQQGWRKAGRSAGRTVSPHTLTLVPGRPLAIEPGSTLTVTIEHGSKKGDRTLGRFRISITGDDRAGEFARTPEKVLAILKTPDGQRTEAQRAEV